MILTLLKVSVSSVYGNVNKGFDTELQHEQH